MRKTSGRVTGLWRIMNTLRLMMKQFRARLLQSALLLLTLFSVQGSAQVRFAQITDPHLFDEESQAINNRKALAACVRKTNELVDAGVNYQFVVITGDIGVEKIVEKLHAEKSNANPQQKDKLDRQIGIEIAKGVGVMTGILSSSRVHLWLFAPGNNDLYKEDPTTIGYYNQFIAQLASSLQQYGIEVRDLCPADSTQPSGSYAKSAAYVYKNKYAFIGFNDASFKNNDESSSLVGPTLQTASLKPPELKRLQETYVAEIRDLLDSKKISGSDVTYAYVFYHIPEIDDPYLISGNEADDPKLKKKLSEREKAITAGAILKSNRYSSWFVDKDVRKSWDDLLKSEKYSKLMGLFAGHLHDWRRETYESYHWVKSFDYASASLSKLYICPPIAVKLQLEQPDQARGFMDVTIDRQGRVLDEWGRDGAHIFWYNQSTDGFDADENEKETEWLSQLTIGRIYEDTGKFAEAEAAYQKALASKSGVTRESASASLQRTAEKQISPLNRYFFTPWGFSLSLEGHALLISTSLLLILVTVWLRERQFNVPFATVHLLPYALAFVGSIFALWLAASYLYQNGLTIPLGTALALAVIVSILGAGLLWSILSGQGKNTLIVASLADTTEAKLGATFPHVIGKIRKEIIASLEHRVSGTYENVPMDVQPVRLGEESNLAELIGDAVPGRFGKLASWLVRQATRPEFYLRGSLQSVGVDLMMILTLESAKHKQTWFLRFAVVDLTLSEEDLAYEVLIFTIAPELYDDAS